MHSSDVDQDDDSDDSVVPFSGSRPSEDYDNEEDPESDDDSESNFIVEDTETFELPLQFSRESHADLSHQFKKVFQLFVHVAVQQPSHRAKFMKKQLEEEEYFAVPLTTLRRKLSSLKDSLVASSVWKPDFKKSLEIYPEIELVRLDFAVPFCDACHLGGRMSTLLGRVTGAPYNGCGFEPLKLKNKDDNDQKKEFHLGRFCARRTKVYHQFMHWERALFRIIVDEIESLGGKSKDKVYHRVAFFGGKEPPQDLTNGDDICEWLDQRKVIDMEWHKIKELMESARHLEVADGRDDEDLRESTRK
ncbi:hypothetical protein CVT24_010550 [Panaeolus cyanescens]|uniref:DUF4211 domain-containing protein n=1 Tax=Panaeolus cyanescens TaxID=181874 RepID=A0A409YYN0_9AGAR|nr:hypothetical protein CVT24_010550 [Panaeolus cyanescens]